MAKTPQSGVPTCGAIPLSGNRLVRCRMIAPRSVMTRSSCTSAGTLPSGCGFAGSRPPEPSMRGIVTVRTVTLSWMPISSISDSIATERLSGE